MPRWTPLHLSAPVGASSSTPPREPGPTPWKQARRVVLINRHCQGQGGRDALPVTPADCSDNKTMVTLAGANDEPMATDTIGAAFTTGNVLANDNDPNSLCQGYGSSGRLQQRELLGPRRQRSPRSMIGQRRRNLHPRSKRHFDHLFEREAAADAFSFAIQSNHGRSRAARVIITISGVWNFAHADDFPEPHGNDVSGDSNPTWSML